MTIELFSTDIEYSGVAEVYVRNRSMQNLVSSGIGKSETEMGVPEAILRSQGPEHRG